MQKNNKIRSAIKDVIDKKDLSFLDMEDVMREIMEGNATPAQIGSFLTAMRLKGETVDEISGAASIMREKCDKVKTDTGKVLVDTCGTGGDGSDTFNISTVSAFVAAGAGVTIAKHGNRSVSSNCGSADLLSELGVNIAAEKIIIEKAIKEVGIGFLFAPVLHRSMKYALEPRREIGIRTIFNILGPLTNPAEAKRQTIGVYSKNLTETIAKVLKKLGSTHVFVFHGDDGLDEITLTDVTTVSHLKEGSLSTFTICPEDFGFKRCRLSELKGGTPETNAAIAKSILSGEKGPKRNVVLLNAAAAIVAGGAAETLEAGIESARRSIDSGSAMKKLYRLIDFTNK